MKYEIQNGQCRKMRGRVAAFDVVAENGTVAATVWNHVQGWLSHPLTTIPERGSDRAVVVTDEGIRKFIGTNEECEAYIAKRMYENRQAQVSHEMQARSIARLLDRLQLERSDEPKPVRRTDLPPDPEDMNDDRAEWAEIALHAFMGATGTDPEDAICDLIADLLHLCDREPDTYGDFETGLSRGRGHYEAETEGTGPYGEEVTPEE